MEEIRSFIAIELPEGLKTELRRLQTRLKSDGPTGVRWVDPASIHLTVKFLGDVPVDKLSEVTAAMSEAVQGILSFRLEVGGLGAFPNLSHVQVVWVGVDGETDKLAQLVQRIESRLSQLGFPEELRPFSPHLTLARVGNRVLPEERKRLGQLIAGTKFESSHAIEVNSINLMKSELTREGAVYRLLRSVKLGEDR